MIPKSRIVPPCLAAILLAGAAVGDDRYQQSTEELAKVRGRIDAVSKSIEHDKVEQDQLRGAVEAAELKVDQAGSEARRIAAQVDLQEAKVRQAQAQEAAARRRLAEQKEALASQLRASYMMGRGGKAELLLSQEDPDRVDRMLVYFDSLNRARASAIAAIDAEIQRVAELEAQYQAELDTLHKLQASHKQALAALEATRQERTAAMRRS
jgi:septal ring factor EnvC (AmiA/AmiB activator)